MNTSSYSLATLVDWIGREIGTSQWVTVDQDRINDFARSTGEHQWIHVDVERAKKESPFGAPVAHGYLTLALLADASMNIGVVPKDAVAALNYGFWTRCASWPRSRPGRACARTSSWPK